MTPDFWCGVLSGIGGTVGLLSVGYLLARWHEARRWGRL